ncbi:MAG: decarboxylating NADP(+)-dependent phosphogluconate dehydrogenase [Sphaerochaetaceae bacterium]|nr:decarboxylating NADP(+)-dependent phosphogluconate dehydrogenase [Sphaerochaetaceae bacterium]
MNEKANIGLIGLAVMGENLVMNMESKGYKVAVFNRSVNKVDNFINTRAQGKNIIGTHSLEELVSKLETPRKVMLLVKAGEPVDSFINQLLPLLDKEDIIIDGGNSYFKDTIRRTKLVEDNGLYYIGTGVSGGEEGALKGPSLMPGGSLNAWNKVKDILQNISAKVEDGSACCDWVGLNGAGHFVKMVHNGIEYGDMQLICEAYSLMKNVLNLSNDEMHEIFSEWNKSELNSYLIEITADILTHKEADGFHTIDKILDTAGQKGTGKWTGISSLDQGVALTLITEAVFARYISAMKDERVEASPKFKKPVIDFKEDKKEFIEKIKNALLVSKIISYAQGFSLMMSAAKTYDWDLNYGSIALMWRGGCIIRSSFLKKIKEAYDTNPDLNNLILDPYFANIINKCSEDWREVVSVAVKNGIAVPAFSSALNYFDAYTCERLPANLLQAQRDYFGAHTYERVDMERNKFFHTNWTGEGGKTSSSTYNA